MVVEFIPKQEQKPIFGQMFFVIVSIVLVAGVVFSILLLQQSVEAAREEFAALNKTFVEEIQPFKEELSAKLQDYKEKTEVLKSVLDEKKNALAFLALLEQTTHPGVFFKSLSGSMKTRVFELEGEAQDFIVLEQQRLIWNSKEEFQSELRNIRLNEEGAVEFTVEFIVAPEILDPI